MSDAFNPTDSLYESYILQDENGNEKNFRLIDFYKEGDKLYFALVPDTTDPSELQGGMELVVLAVQPGANGVDELTNIDDPDEYDRIQMIFLQRLAEELDPYRDDDDEEEDEAGQ